MYVYGKARRQWQRAFFMFVQTHKKAALPIIKVDAAFLLLSSETVSRFPLCKDFVNLKSNTIMKKPQYKDTGILQLVNS